MSYQVEATHVNSRSVYVESDSRIRLDEVQVDFVAQEFADIADAIPATHVSKQGSVDQSHFWTYLIIVGRSRLNPQP